MIEKDTQILLNEIKETCNPNDFLTKNKSEFEARNFNLYFDELLKKYKKKKSDVVNAANLDRTYAYQIISGARTGSRDKIIALIFGFSCLTVEEAQRFLKLYGLRELYAGDPRDAIILYALNKKIGLAKAGTMLDENGFDSLSSKSDA